jgi:hypothetical protein
MHELNNKFKTILQYDPNIVLFGRGMTRVESQIFHELEVESFDLIVENCTNKKYILALASFIVSKRSDSAMFDLASHIKTEIENNPEDSRFNKASFADNFLIFQQMSDSLKSNKLPLFIKKNSQYSTLLKDESSPKYQKIKDLDYDLEKILLIMKFICIESSKEIKASNQQIQNGEIENKNIFLENFLELINFQGDIDQQDEDSKNAINLFAGLDSQFKEFIVEQILLLKSDSKSPIMEFVENQTVQNLKFFSSLISIENCIKNPAEEKDASVAIKILNLIDRELLDSTATDPRYRDHDDIIPFKLSSVFNERLDRMKIFSSDIADKITNSRISSLAHSPLTEASSQKGVAR